MNQKLAAQNHKYCIETLELKSQLEIKYLDLGERLYKIAEAKMFEPNYETFNDFLEEVKISPATASKLINIYSRFVLEFKIKPQILADAGGWAKAAEVLPFAENKTQAEAWLQKAASLSKTDLRREITEARTGISMATCEHEDKILFTRCSKCGIFERVHEKE